MRRMRRRRRVPAATAGRVRPRGRQQREAGTHTDSRTVAAPGPKRVGGAEEGEGGPGPRAPGQSVSRSPPPTRAPREGDLSHKAPIARKGKAEASKPRCLRSGPPLPRGLPACPGPGKPPSPPGPVPGTDGGRNGGEGRAAHRGARAPLLLWAESRGG